MTQSDFHTTRDRAVSEEMGFEAPTENTFCKSSMPGMPSAKQVAAQPEKSVPCFVAGTRMVTKTGLVVIEDLKPGDQVLTRDNGFQALQWIGRSSRRAYGDDAPVEITAGTFGNHEAIRFSRNHRLLVKSDAAMALFGESEVLMRAGDLINNTTVRWRNTGQLITYVHLLFERHEIVRANGLDCESYHPCHETLDSFDPATQQEVLSFMPNSDRFMGYGYGPTARVSLRPQEARALMQAA